MEGNEPCDNNCCLECEQVCDEDFYRCDSCLRRIHKNCTNISASESRCMTLQKRVLLYLCDECKLLVARMPYMVKLLEDMRKDIDVLKTNNKRSADTYASVLQTKPNEGRGIAKHSAHTIIIKPKVNQSSEKSRKEVQKSINPTKINVGIRDIKETKSGCIVLKCDTEQEIKRLTVEVENKLKGKYEVERPKKTFPKIKIAGYTGGEAMDTLEKTIREQNTWIDSSEHLKVSFVRKLKNKPSSTIYAECSGSLLVKMLDHQKVCIGWERLPVYEDLNVARCFNCQGFHHKSNKCTRGLVCGNCSEEHNTLECDKNTKRCINCMTANEQYKLGYDINHKALDSNCPSLKYHTLVLKNKIDYNS